jgi:molecular chaperone GrpE
MSEEKENRANLSDDELIEGEFVDEGGEDTQSGGDSQTTEATGPAMVSAEEYEKLAQELQQAQGKQQEYFEGWQRERADFANYKKRIDRDQRTLSQNITVEVIKKYLAVIDDLERALKTRPTEGTAASWANGIELIYRKLTTILENESVRRIPAETEEFDPNRHEAISYEESPEHESGQIIDVVQQGYTLGDRVIRPAMVRVAR